MSIEQQQTSIPVGGDVGWLLKQQGGMLSQLEGILQTQRASEALLERALEAKKSKLEEANQRELKRVEDGGEDGLLEGDMSVYVELPAMGELVEDNSDVQTYVRKVAATDRVVVEEMDDIENDVKRALTQVRDSGVRGEEEVSEEDVWGSTGDAPIEGCEVEDHAKPWQSSLCPPTAPSSSATDKAPNVTLELDHIFGYKARSSWGNIAAISPTAVVYPVGCVGVVMDTTTKEQHFFRSHDNDITCLGYSEAHGIVASGQIGRVAPIYLWHSRTRQVLAELTCHLRGVAAVCISQDGLRLASVGLDADHTVIIHDISQAVAMAKNITNNTSQEADERAVCPELVRQGSGPVPGIGVCWSSSPSRPYTLTLVGLGGVAFWSTSSPTGPFTQRTAKYGAFAGLSTSSLLCCRSIHPSLTLAGSSTGALLLFVGSTLVEVVDAHKRAVLCIELIGTCTVGVEGSVQHTVLTSGQDGYVHTWTITHNPTQTSREEYSPQDTTTNDEFPVIARLPTHAGTYSVTQNGECVGSDPVRAISLVPSDYGGTVPSTTTTGGKCVFGSASGTLWDVTLGKKNIKKIAVSHHGDLQNVAGYGELCAGAAHPGGEPIVVTAGEDRVMRLWNLDRKLCTRSAELADKAVCLAWSPAPGYKYIAMGTMQGSIVLLNSKNLFVLSSIRPSLKRAQCMTFSPDGSMLAVGGADNTIRLYQVSNERDELVLMRTIQSHTSTITHLDFSADGEKVQSCTQAYELLFHQVSDGSHIVDPTEVRDTVWATHSCILGWNVQGIWPRRPEGTEVNSVCVSCSRKEGGGEEEEEGRLLAVAEVSGLVKLFRYPCIGSGLHPTQGTLPRRPASVAALGHTQNVTTVLFAGKENKYLVSLGGSDNAVFVWRIYASKEK